MSLKDYVSTYCAECGAEIENDDECYRIGNSYYCTNCVEHTYYEADTVEEFYADDMRDLQRDLEEDN